jgi:prephenate dehydrogenase
MANKPALLAEITAYESALSKLKQKLTDNDATELEALFTRASTARNQWAHLKQKAKKVKQKIKEKIDGTTRP